MHNFIEHFSVQFRQWKIIIIIIIIIITVLYNLFNP